MFYLTTHSTHFIYGYMASDMVKDHSDSEKGNPCRHIGYSFRLTARVLLYAPSHRQDSTYHSLCYTSRLMNKDRNTHCSGSNGSYLASVESGARCSSVVRAFAHGAMGRRIDPSWGGTIELFLVPASAP